MHIKPSFIRTVDPESLNDVHFDVNVMFISSHKLAFRTLSLVVVEGVEHYVFTGELEELVHLPKSIG
jgi:hypothetical protein